MRLSILLAVIPALAGCTMIPPADPGRAGSPRSHAHHAPQPMPQGPAPGPVSGSGPVYAPAPPYTPPPEAPAPQGPGPLTYAAIGQTVRVDGPRLTPLQVLEDSRCPMNARCVWAGQVRLRVRIESGTGGEIELTSGKPASVADGTLELVEVQPDKATGGKHNGAISNGAYRFGFRFVGGY